MPINDRLDAAYFLLIFIMYRINTHLCLKIELQVHTIIILDYKALLQLVLVKDPADFLQSHVQFTVQSVEIMS